MNKGNGKRRWPLIGVILLISTVLIGINIVYALRLDSAQKEEGQAILKRDEAAVLTRRLEQRLEELLDTRFQQLHLNSRVERLLGVFRTDDLREVALKVIEQVPTKHALHLQPRHHGKDGQYWIKVPEAGHSLMLRCAKSEQLPGYGPYRPRDNYLDEKKIPLDPGQVYRVGFQVKPQGSELQIRLNEKVVFEKRVPGKELQSSDSRNMIKTFTSPPGIISPDSPLLNRSFDVPLLKQGCWVNLGATKYEFGPPQGDRGKTVFYDVRFFLQSTGDVYRHRGTGQTGLQTHRDVDKRATAHPTDPDLLRVGMTGDLETKQ